MVYLGCTCIMIDDHPSFGMAPFTNIGFDFLYLIELPFSCFSSFPSEKREREIDREREREILVNPLGNSMS